MKAKTIIALAWMIMSCLGFAEEKSFSRTYVSDAMRPIIIVRHGTQSGGAPHAPSNVRITAEYDDVACIVYAYLQNAGSLVDITIENQSTGSTTSNLVSGNGTAMIPISGCSGNWVITFVLLNGDEYEGEFVL